MILSYFCNIELGIRSLFRVYIFLKVVMGYKIKVYVRGKWGFDEVVSMFYVL